MSYKNINVRHATRMTQIKKTNDTNFKNPNLGYLLKIRLIRVK
jgi:hypothetical protein